MRALAKVRKRHKFLFHGRNARTLDALKTTPSTAAAQVQNLQVYR